MINGGKVLAVTKNFWGLLVILSQSKEVAAGQWFWADQVSIDQGATSERGHQVRLMAEIYSRATIVYAYIGPEPASPLYTPKALLDATLGQYNFHELIEGRLEIERQENGKQNTVKLKDEGVKYYFTLLDLFTRGYWDRLWIVQELSFAQAVHIWCGSFSIHRNHLRGALSWLLHYERSLLHSERYGPSIIRRAQADQAVSTIQLILDHHFRHFWLTETTHQEMSMQGTILQYGKCLCSDPRDKVFGLQALVKPDQRVEADYSKSIGEVLREVLETCMANLPRDRTWNLSRRRGFNQMVESGVGGVFDVLKALTGYVPEDCKIMHWAFIVLLTPQPIAEILRVLNDGFEKTWEQMSSRILVMATTARQKEYTLDLVHHVADVLMIQSKTFRSQRRQGPACSGESKFGYGEAMLDYYHQHVATELQDIIDDLATKHGFVRRGRFLYHPLEIPFAAYQPPPEAKSDGLPYAQWDAWMGQMEPR
jgi:hypothetical protein